MPAKQVVNDFGTEERGEDDGQPPSGRPGGRVVLT
jgi:hypothetical protein